ncbi:MAG TPA: twin transmembrane helix small protein [Steroidobacteraceae bacterium]|nr:twin transmembrane helix small protein [Steroidobacteraceae bacterium]
MTRLLILGCLLAIVLSLGSALISLVRNKGESSRMVQALTLRIGLSVLLFVLLLVAWRLGWIEPHVTR